jgi:hypothetical protein
MASPVTEAEAGVGVAPPADLTVAGLLATVEALRAENAELRQQLLHRPSGHSLSAGAGAGGEGGLQARSSSSVSEAGVQANAKAWRNKAALDQETGRKAFNPPHVDRFRHLFNQSDLLQFEEDSPSFRLKIDELVSEVLLGGVIFVGCEFALVYLCLMYDVYYDAVYILLLLLLLLLLLPCRRKAWTSSACSRSSWWTAAGGTASTGTWPWSRAGSSPGCSSR